MFVCRTNCSWVAGIEREEFTRGGEGDVIRAVLPRTWARGRAHETTWARGHANEGSAALLPAR